MLRAGFAVALALACCSVTAATRFHFTTDVERVYPSHVTTTVTVDGAQWRIDYNPESNVAVFMTALMTIAPDKVIALNDRNQTWYNAKPLAGFGSVLFEFRPGYSVTKVKVGSKPDGTIEFSYRTGSASVPIDVWGDSKIVSGSGGAPVSLFAISTNYPEVDEAFRKLIPASPVESETHVNRRYEGGKAQTQIIRRKISDITTVDADPSLFAIPAGYKYQEPQIGAPGR